MSSPLLVAIDAGWLGSITGWEGGALFDAFKILEAFRQEQARLLLDHERLILGEYQRVFAQTQDPIGKEFLKMVTRFAGFSEYRPGKPSNSCTTALDGLGFDNDDLPYVGVAQHGPAGIYLTHETKHVRSDVSAVLSSECGVRVADTAGMLALL